MREMLFNFSENVQLNVRFTDAVDVRKITGKYVILVAFGKSAISHLYLQIYEFLKSDKSVRLDVTARTPSPY